MTWSDPVDATANVTAVTAAREKTYILDNLRAIAEWTSYTPTLTQGGAVTKTVTYAKYKSYGGTVDVIGYLSITGSGTANNIISVSLPVTASTSTQLVIGVGHFTDSGASLYPLLVVLNSTTAMMFQRTDTNNTDNFGKDPNFALASGDILKFSCSYEAA